MADKKGETAETKHEKRVAERALEKEKKAFEQRKMLVAYDEAEQALERVQRQLDEKADFEENNGGLLEDEGTYVAKTHAELATVEAQLTDKANYNARTNVYTPKVAADQVLVDRLASQKRGILATVSTSQTYVDRLVAEAEGISHNKDQIFNEYQRLYSFGFNRDYTKYKRGETIASYAALGGIGAESTERRETTPGSAERAALGQEIQVTAGERSRPEIIQQLKEAGLSPTELTVAGPNRIQAIRICVPPEEASTLIELLASNPTEANRKLQAIRATLQPAWETQEALNKDFNEFDPERAKQKAAEVLKGAPQHRNRKSLRCRSRTYWCDFSRLPYKDLRARRCEESGDWTGSCRSSWTHRQLRQYVCALERRDDSFATSRLRS